MVIFISCVMGICIWIVYRNTEHLISPSNYRLLISAQCREYQDWQCLGLRWSADKNWPGVKYSRLLSCSDSARKNYKYHNLMPTFLASDWSIHPNTKDDYAPYNRPISIKEYLEGGLPNEEYLVIIDPDTVICKPLDDLNPQLGKPVAQRYEYLMNKNALTKLGEIFGVETGLQPIGMPMIIHREDLARIAPLWVELTEKIRNDPAAKEIAGWVAEMHSYCLASAALGLEHTVRDDLADRIPYDRVADPYILHYDLKHQHANFVWDKRNYLSTDMLVKEASLMPVPREYPNHKYLKVFTTLNDALTDYKHRGN